MTENKPMATAVVVNDDLTQLGILCALAAEAGLKPLSFTGAEDALLAMNPEAPPGLIVTDLNMPGIDGCRFCRLLRSPEYAAFNNVPILVVSATVARYPSDLIAADMGADDFLSSPVDGEAFRARVLALLAGKETRRRPRALIVGEDKTLAGAIKNVFIAHGYRADTVLSVREAEDACDRTAYDVAVLDYRLPDGTGDALIDVFRIRRPDGVCLMMSTDPTPELVLDWMKRGASACLRKPFDPELLVEHCTRARCERTFLRNEDLLDARTRELRECKARYRVFFEGINDAVFVHEIDDRGQPGRFLDVNEAACQRLGYTRAELLSMTPRDITDPAEYARLDLPRTELEDQGYILIETVHLTKDGRRIPVESNIRRITYLERPVALSVSRDVTEHKMADEKLHAAEETYRNIFLNAQVGMFRTDVKTGIVLDANSALARFVGYQDREEMLAAPFSIAERYVNPGDREKMVALLMAEGEFTDLECPFRRNDGTTILMRYSARLVPGRSWIEGVSVDVTRERQAEESLRRKNEELSTMLDALPVMAWISHDPECLDITGNRAVNEIFATSPGTNVLQSAAEKGLALEIKHLDKDGVELGANQLPMQQAIATGQPVLNRELTYQLPDGRQIFALGNAVPLFEETGRIRGAVGAYLDITDRRRAETSLLESEERFKSLHNASFGGIAIHDRGIILECNQGLADMTGYSVAELTGGMDGLLLIAEKDRTTVLSKIQSGYEKPYEAIGLRKNGDEYPMRLEARNIHYKGKNVRTVEFRDITEQKRAAENIIKLTGRLDLALASTKAGVWDWDLKTNELIWDDRMLELYGLTRENFPGRVETWEQGLHPDDSARAIEECQAALRGERDFDTEFRVRHHDGTVIHIKANGLVQRDAEGKPIRMIGLNTDITDRKWAEAEREKLQVQLMQAQKMESVGRLAGGVAHDFNNMLGVILGHTEMALEQLDPTQPLFADLQEVRNAAVRSADLTRQLLAFARKQTISPRIIDLNKTVEGMLKMLRRIIGEDIDLIWLPCGNVGLVRVDPSQIDQILANLCVNARDAIAGVGKITIETGAAEFDKAYCADHVGFVPGEYVLLAVSDNGCGMVAETLGLVFEPFFTTKELGKGTGLGLASVYGAVKQNSGFINVYSEPGRGTTFRIYLPRHQAGAQVEADAATAKSAARGSEIILLVEDEPAILKMATMMLERQGYGVIGAKTPGEAIRLAREYKGRIDLLITDVVMPEMNGRDLARNLLSVYPDINRLFMSGYTANVIAHHGVLDPGVHFIQKPFSMTELAAIIREALGQE